MEEWWKGGGEVVEEWWKGGGGVVEGGWRGGRGVVEDWSGKDFIGMFRHVALYKCTFDNSHAFIISTRDIARGRLECVSECADNYGFCS